MKKEKFVIVPLFLIMALLVSTTVTSFVSQYLEDNTFKILYQHDDTFRILLQNSKDEIKSFEIDVNSSVASIDGIYSERYDLQPRSDQEVFFNILLPEGHSVGDEYQVEYMVRELVESAENNPNAMIGIGPAYLKRFRVLVVSQNPPRFDTDYVELVAYVSKLFEYNVNCKDEDGDKLYYDIDSLLIDIDESGFISFTPKFFGSKKLKVTCSDGVDTAEKTIKIKVKDPLFFLRWWFLLSIAVIITVIVVFRKMRDRKLLEEEILEESKLEKVGKIE